MTPLRAQGVSKRFGSHQVLQGVDLHIDAGRAVVLLGPNGAGKSTLLACICGTLIPDEGTIEIGGHDLVAEPIAARAALRYLPQEPEVPEGITGLEYLAFHADVHGDRPGLERAMRATGLAESLERLATTYSVGMRRRLSFATIVPGRSALIVLDEPFAGVDAQGRARMLEILQQLQRNGAGLLLAAHDRDEAELEALDARPFDLLAARPSHSKPEPQEATP